eukprot:gene8853-biopygen1632
MSRLPRRRARGALSVLKPTAPRGMFMRRGAAQNGAGTCSCVTETYFCDTERRRMAQKNVSTYSVTQRGNMFQHVAVTQNGTGTCSCDAERRRSVF